MAVYAECIRMSAMRVAMEARVTMLPYGWCLLW